MSCGKDKNHIFSREEIHYMIILYEQETCLYEVTSLEYKNKTRRQQAFQRITADFNKRFLTNLCLEEIRKKINALRTQFYAELNKIKKSMASGSGSDDVYSPSWTYFENLSFLNTGNPVRTSTSNLEAPTEVPEQENELLFEGATGVSESESFLTPTTSTYNTSSSVGSDKENPRKRRKSQNVTPQALALIEKASKLLEEPVGPPAPLGVIDAFLGTVGAELREIKNPLRSRQVRRKILDIIYKAQEEEDEEIV